MLTQYQSSESSGYTFIYELYDPKDKQPRYVGKTVNPRHRHNEHLRRARRQTNYSYCCKWINKLFREGREPVMMVIGCVSGDGSEKERQMIKLYKDAGFNLTNIRDGGEGGSLGKPVRPNRSEDAKRKTSQSLKAYYERMRQTYGQVVGTEKQTEARKRNGRNNIARLKEAAKRQTDQALKRKAERALLPKMSRQENWSRLRRELVPLTVNGNIAMVPLTYGKWAMIDVEDWDKVREHKWRAQDGKACTWDKSNGTKRIIYMGTAITGKNRAKRLREANAFDYRKAAFTRQAFLK